MTPKYSSVKAAQVIAATLANPLLGAAVLGAQWGGTQKDQVESDLKGAETEAAFEREMRVQQGLLTIAEGRARVARELAIARRIDTAEEVELEEYFDVAKEGKGGVSVDGKGASLGGSGSGKTVSKRVYRFKGWRDGGLEALMAQIGQLSEEEQELDALKVTENET